MESFTGCFVDSIIEHVEFFLFFFQLFLLFELKIGQIFEDMCTLVGDLFDLFFLIDGQEKVWGRFLVHCCRQRSRHGCRFRCSGRRRRPVDALGLECRRLNIGQIHSSAWLKLVASVRNETLIEIKPEEIGDKHRACVNTTAEGQNWEIVWLRDVVLRQQQR